MRKVLIVLALVLSLSGGSSALAEPPLPLEDGFSCEYTNRAEKLAKDASRAPNGGPERGEEAAAKKGNAQFNFCDQYSSE